MLRSFASIFGACLSLLGFPASAAGPAEEAALLGKTLTPMGAERAGNAAGTIPAWEGGLTKAPAGYKDGAHYPDPFADDRPLFTIDAKNLASYRQNLTPGQAALLGKYPTWKMLVYPTRRSAAFPDGHYRETLANATKAQLAEGGNGVTGTRGGIPFPIPKNGLEAIWNHLLRYRGDAFSMTWDQASVTRTGDYTPVRMETDFHFQYGNLAKRDAERAENRHFDFLQTVTAPARLAGQILLVHEYVDQVKSPRAAWTYNPGQRRVRLAPNVAYDNPGTASDGLRTNDDFLMYNGAVDRYTWTLVGKREIYVPYNAYRLNGNVAKYEDVIRPHHVNPEFARYELHRVWVVDATLKPGTTHIYARRTFYIDEDSWNVVVADKYDGRGGLWRVAELHSINFYNFPMLFPTLEVHHDLQSERYIAAGLRNEVPSMYKRTQRPESHFTPTGLRGEGVR